MDAINAIAAKHDIAVIEDCAQSTGARYKGRKVGAIGDHAYYTFGLTKNITTLSGAMVTTNDDAVAAHIRATIEQSGMSPAKKSIKEAVSPASRCSSLPTLGVLGHGSSGDRHGKRARKATQSMSASARLSEPTARYPRATATRPAPAPCKPRSA